MSSMTNKEQSKNVLKLSISCNNNDEIKIQARTEICDHTTGYDVMVIENTYEGPMGFTKENGYVTSGEADCNIHETPEETAKCKEGYNNVASAGKKILDLHNPESPLLKKIARAVSQFEKITILKLNFCFLKHIPDDIHMLPLHTLDVSGNMLSEIPNCLHLGLLQLKCLNLCNNSLSEFDLAPSCIKSLKKLFLSKNRFMHPPSWIFQFECVLMEMFYNDNPRVVLKQQITLNQSLQRLEMRNCHFFNFHIDYLKVFERVQHINLSNSNQFNLNNINKLEGICKMLNLQGYLRVLHLSGLGIPEVPKTIEHLSNLRVLNLSYNNLSHLPDSIVKLSWLQVLKLGNNKLIELPRNLFRLHSLQVLEAEFNLLSDVQLFGLYYLKRVDLYNNKLTHADLANSIEMIDMDRNPVDGVKFCRDYEHKRDLFRGTRMMYFNRLFGCSNS